MSSATRSPQAFDTVVIVGGGCYGSYYVQQLERAAMAGAVQIRQVLVVDRNADCAVAQRAVAAGELQPTVVVAEWTAFFAERLARGAEAPAFAAADAIVPSPLMPHLLFQWIAERARTRWPARDVRTVPVDAVLPVPWQRPGDDGTHYASFATWLCPINCIEPGRCPHTRGARDWSMPVALRRHVVAASTDTRPTTGPYIFHCTHRVYGVGMIDVASVLAADSDLAARAADGPVDALVATVSHCHGAVSRLIVPGPDAAPDAASPTS